RPDNMPDKVMKERAAGASTRRRNKISNAVRDQIVLDHLKLVKAIAVRVHENLLVHVDLDDLVHAGVLASLKPPTSTTRIRKRSFTSYAKYRIKGAILDASLIGLHAKYARGRRWWKLLCALSATNSSARPPRPKSPRG